MSLSSSLNPNQPCGLHAVLWTHQACFSLSTTLLLIFLPECSRHTFSIHSGLYSNIIFSKRTILTNSPSPINQSPRSSYFDVFSFLIFMIADMLYLYFAHFFQQNARTEASCVLFTTISLVSRILGS